MVKITAAARNGGMATPQQPTTPTKEKAPHITAHDPARDYSAMFRVAFDFLKRHSPPPPLNAPEWADVFADYEAQQTRDPLGAALLAAVFAELEAEAEANQ